MTHFSEDGQFLLALAGAGSLIALGISRVKYSKDWLGPWLTVTTGLSFLALVVIAVNEREAIYDWWRNAPIVASAFLASSAALALRVWLRWKQSHSSLVNLALDESEMPKDKGKVGSWPLVSWGLINLSVFLYSIMR
jgi:hypothetical protein